jgi:hypothetical protein
LRDIVRDIVRESRRPFGAWAWAWAWAWRMTADGGGPNSQSADDGDESRGAALERSRMAVHLSGASVAFIKPGTHENH